MDPKCRSISRLILPAIRASIAQIMRQEYNYRQKEIAERLGVVQVAVSKYLNGRYSAEIENVKQYIIKNGLSRKIVADIVGGKPEEEISGEIDSLCGTIAEEMPPEGSLRS